MLKQKRSLIIAILSSFILVSALYGSHIYLTWAKENDYILPRLLLINIAPVAFGIILGALQLLSNPNKKFYINWIDIIIQGIPAFLIAFPPFFSLIRKPPLYFSAGHINVSTMAGVWLGYIIITSLFKEVSNK